MAFLSEAQLESALLAQLASLGYATVSDELIGPDGAQPERAAENDWLAVQQFTVVAGQTKRRPDVVLFVNGLPLAVIELKAPGGENATLAGAFNQLQTYKQQISALLRSNALLVTSDGLSARGRARCRRIWSASCPGAPPTARASSPRVRRRWRR